MKQTLVLVGPKPPPVHGVTISTERLLNSDLKEGFNLVHLDTSDHRSVDSIGAIDFMNIWLAVTSYAKLVHYCIKYKPSLIYIPISQSLLGFLRDSVYVFLPKILCRTKVVIHLRGGYFGQFYAGSRYITRKYIDLTMWCVDRVIVLGEALRNIFSRWFAPAAIDVVPNGTDMRIDGVEDRLRTQRSGPILVTYLSSLIRSKGIVDFVKAAKPVATRHGEAKFNVAGEWWGQEPELAKEVIELVKKEGIEDKLVFLGLVTGEHKKDLLLETDIFVLPTYYPFEGHPNAIIEAMAAGCVVVSTDHAAIPETVLDGETGLIVPAKSPEQLASAICRLIDDRSLLWSMAKASYARYKSNYTGARSTKLLTDSLLRTAKS